jgi:AraC-like DNA-binding protein
MELDFFKINDFLKKLNNFRDTTNIIDFFFIPHIVHLNKLLAKDSNKIHVHPTFEISLVLTGEISYQIGNKDFLLHQGDLVIIPPNIKHYWEVLNENAEIFNFMINISTHGDGARRNLKQLNTSIEKYHYHIKKLPTFEQIIMQIINEATEQKTACREKVLYLTRIAFVELIRILLPKYYNNISPHNVPPVRGEKKTDIVEIIDFYIQDNLNRQITLLEISKHVGLSIGYLNVLFKKETGTTINQLIINKRLAKACRYLKQTDRQVKDIATLLGYNDINYFYSQFKNKYKTTPAKYRNNNS